MSDSSMAASLGTPATDLFSTLHSLRQTPPRLIQSPPTQPRRASVALILRMKPAEGLVFEGHEPEGWTGDVIKREDWGLGLALEDFFRLDWVNHPRTIPELLFIRRASSQPSSSTNSASSSSGSSSSSSSSSSTGSSATRWSSHIAFPGGRHEPSDESALYTAYRETWEEIGVDLAEKEFVQAGRLDEREITTSLGKRLLMILSPFVFLQTTPFSPEPELQVSEVSSVHWIPLSSLTPPFAPEQWSQIEIDISSRLSPRNKLIRWALRGLVGKMEFGCVLLPDEPDHVAEGFNVENEFIQPAEGSGSWYNKDSGRRMLRLWGLSLGMTLDLLAHHPSAASPTLFMPRSRASSRATSPERIGGIPPMPRTPFTVNSSFDEQWDAARRAVEVSANPDAVTPSVEKRENGVIPGSSGSGMSSTGQLGARVDVKSMKGRRRRGVGPGVTAVFPRFSYPDVNFWIWVFGRKYRQVVKGWEASVRDQARAADRRTNWSGAALATFYSAVRQALVVAIVIRALATGVGLAGLAWFLFKRIGTGSASVGEL